MRYLSTTDKAPRLKIRANYEQLPEFETGHIVGLKEAEVHLPFFLQYPQLIFLHDNARPFTERDAINFLVIHQTLPWSAKSPDLSPIQHVWDMMKM
ncbi:hypothetical protein TNCV_770851 [Trichonephila clavipes]|nr:hypothetical protein TNCV_770851 [Trichonephila clavipes]